VSDADNLRATGDRIAQLLEQFESLPDPRAGEWAEELVRLVTSMYGEGLARALELACGPESVAGPALLARLAEDELLASLLLLHGLHPDGMRSRVERALAELGRSLGSSDVRLLDADEEAGSVRVRLLSDHGRAVSASLEQLVRRAIESAAPEVVAIEVERPLPSTPVRLGRRPSGDPPQLVTSRSEPVGVIAKASS
jgi:hypothetical protein